jgi:hypothetical protein
MKDAYSTSSLFTKVPDDILLRNDNGEAFSTNTLYHRHMAIQREECILDLCTNQRTLGDAAELRSAGFKGSAEVCTLSWMKKLINSEQFVSFLAERLLIPVFPDDADIKCSCKRSYVLAQMDLNSLRTHHHKHCAKTTSRNALHDKTVDLLTAYIMKVRPTAQILPKAKFRKEGNKYLEVDATITIGEQVYAVDVTFTSPSQPSLLTNINLPTGNYGDPEDPKNVVLTENYAAMCQEQHKIEHYLPIRGQVTKFIPLVFETTGRPGPSVLAFLDDMEGRIVRTQGPRPPAVHSARREFLRQVVYNNTVTRAKQRDYYKGIVANAARNLALGFPRFI